MHAVNYYVMQYYIRIAWRKAFGSVVGWKAKRNKFCPDDGTKTFILCIKIVLNSAPRFSLVFLSFAFPRRRPRSTEMYVK